jgi:uncharacterized protein (DUF2062 family)
MLHDMSFHELWGPVLKPLAIGAVPLGILFGLIFYGITRWAMVVFQEQRRKRMAEKAARLPAHSEKPSGIGSALR